MGRLPLGRCRTCGSIHEYSEKGAHVYFFRDLTDGLIKIGTSYRLSGRWGQIERGRKTRVALLGLLPGWLSQERAVIARFRDLRTSQPGDWFEPGEPLLAFIRESDAAGFAANALRINRDLQARAEGRYSNA